MNRKGQFVLKVIITLVISVLLLVVPLMCVSKFFRLSEQAKKDFFDFSEQLKDFAADPSKQSFDHVLILDQKTAIVTFTEKGQPAYFEDESIIPEYRERFEVNFPNVCDQVPCLCLCGTLDEGQEYDITCRSLECRTFPGVNMVMDPPLSVYRSNYDDRRVLIHAYKFDDGSIRIEKEPTNIDSQVMVTH